LVPPVSPMRREPGQVVPRGRRALVFIALLAVVAAALIADHLVGQAAPASGAPISPVVAQVPAGAVSSTWFCPPATTTNNGLADGRIVIANPASTTLTGTVIVAAASGPPVRQAVSVPPRRRKVIRLGDVVQSPYAAATVELNGPSGGVEEQVHGALGESFAPCPTRPSDRWYFASGSTERDDQLLVTLYNPFPEDAIVDLTFATDVGPAEPTDLQGLVVGGRGLAVVDVGDHVRRRAAVATTVVARAGRIVAGKIALRGADGTPPRGVSLTTGQTAPGTQWYFPDGTTVSGSVERYELFNPGPDEARVRVTFIPDRGAAQPRLLTLAPADRLTFDVGRDSGLPPGVGHAAVVSSDNGIPIVVERVITATPPSPPAAAAPGGAPSAPAASAGPPARSGISDLSGSPAADPHWLFAAGAANSVQDEWLTVFNPGGRATRFTVTAFTAGRSFAVEGLAGVAIGAGQRLAVRLGAHLTGGDLMVTVDGQAPIVVERDLYRQGGLGMSAALGIPYSP
jgi:hypothetical protein